MYIKTNITTTIVEMAIKSNFKVPAKSPNKSLVKTSKSKFLCAEEGNKLVIRVMNSRYSSNQEK